MIPLVAELTICKKRNGSFRHFSLPLFFLWMLLLPIALLLAPLIAIVCLLTDVDPIQAGLGLWRTFAALKGSELLFEDRRHSILVFIS